MDDTQFLTVLKKSFIRYLQTKATSTEKLKVLHGAIAKDLEERLNDSKYCIYSFGYGEGKEYKINGHYYDKRVDITIAENEIPIAGIAVKYVMSNYDQNSNNYFENMLGETANIRSEKIPYFQIFVIPDKVPHFEDNGDITGWEMINEHNLKKYIILSNDDIGTFFHAPNKTLVFISHIQDNNATAEILSRQAYREYYQNNDFDMTKSALYFDFGKTFIYNDYDKFIQKVVYAIKSL